MSAVMGDHWDHEVEHYLYRCYDADDRLLYIGCTFDVVGRMLVHQSSWSNPVSRYLNLRMTRHEVQEPAIKGRVAARAAERDAIRSGAPLLNRAHNMGRGLTGEALEAELERTKPAGPDAFALMMDAFSSGRAS